MLIAHISDFHVFADKPETALVRLDAADAARKVVADLAAFSPALDAVIFTGDLCDGGSEADYALLREVLSPLKMPVFVVPGNHDKRATLRAAFADVLPLRDPDFVHYETEIGGIHVIALDTLVEGRVEGRLCPARMAWVRERLSVPRDRPIIVAMHHPPFRSWIDANDRWGLVEGADELGRLIAAQRAGVRILCGHIHRPIQAMWNGAFCAIGGSPAFQIGLDLTPGVPEPGPVREPYCYFVHRVNPDGGGFSVHTRYVRI